MVVVPRLVVITDLTLAPSPSYVKAAFENTPCTGEVAVGATVGVEVWVGVGLGPGVGVLVGVLVAAEVAVGVCVAVAAGVQTAPAPL